MSHRILRGTPGNRLWPALLLLILVVVTPTAVLTWLVGEAAQNERVGVRQRLVEMRRANLHQVQRQLDTQLALDLERCDRLAADWTIQEAAGRALGSLADAYLRFDGQGRMVEPALSMASRADDLNAIELWQDAVRLEFQQEHVRLAAQHYASIEAASEHPQVKARALQAHARCLAKAGDSAAAITSLLRIMQPSLALYAHDPQQRLIALDAGLRTIELMQSASYDAADIRGVSNRLVELLGPEYRTAAPAAQRLFIGRRLQAIFPGEIELPWLAQEQLASQYAALHPAPPPPGTLQPTALNHVWQIASPQQRVVLLFRTATLRARVRQIVSRPEYGSRLPVTLVAPNEPEGPEQVLAAVHLPNMYGWKLAWTHADPATLDAQATRQIAVYGWATMLAIAGIVIGAVLVVWFLGRQQRLQQRQNDWLASVTHELKTPLTSIHLLTDTLIERGRGEPHEYLALISQEATRLSRLIERLLVLARTDAPRDVERRPISPGTIVKLACTLLGDRLQAPGCEFEARIQRDLPDVLGDQDDLAAAVANLLENAWKFSGPSKRILLAVSRERRRVCFAVSDNGPGIPSHHARRIFDRFYQVDRRLAREHGGCGLGLSIVKQTVQAHGGEVSVRSTPGHGATFSIWLPAAPEREGPSTNGRQNANGSTSFEEARAQ